MRRASDRPEPGHGAGSATSEREPGSTRGSRLLRRGLLVAGGVAGAVVLLYAAAALLVHLLVDPAALADRVEPRAEAALNRDVEIEGARVRLFPYLGAELTGVRVANLPDFEGPPLARVGSVSLQVAILPLFRREIRVDEVGVDEPVIRLAVDPAGRTNFGDLVPESREPPPEDAPLTLAVREVRVRDGSLAYTSERDTVRVELAGLAVDAAVEASGGDWTGEVDARSEALVVRHPRLGDRERRLEGPGAVLRGSVAREAGRAEILRGDVRIGAAALGLTGRIEGLDQPVRRVELDLGAEGVELAGLLEALPDERGPEMAGRTRGTLEVDLRIEGPLAEDRRPDVTGTVLLSALAHDGPEGEALVEDLSGRIEVGPDAISLRELAGTVLGGPFSAVATLGADSVRSFEASLEARPALESAAGLGGVPEGMRLAGRLDARLELAGELTRPEETRLDGFVEGADLRLEHPRAGVPISADDLRVEVAGRTARWSGVELTLGEDRLTAAGSLDDPLAALAPGRVPRLELELEGGRLDLDAVLPPRGDPSVTYGRIAFAHLGGRTLEGRSAREWAEEKELALPDSLPAAGEARVRLDTLLSAPHRLADVDLRVVFAPDLVEVPEARFRAYGGRMTTGLRLGVGAGAHQPFSLELEARDLRAADFLETTSPLGRHVTGTLALEMELAGALDERMLPVESALAGSGSARVRNGGLEENPLTRALADALSLPVLAAPSFSEWSVPFEIEGPSVRFAEADLAVPRVGSLRYGGGMGLDGTLDLGLRMAVPAARLDSLALGRAGIASAVVGRWTGGDSPLEVGLGIEGTLEEPRIRPRASLATGDLRRRLEAEVEERTGALRDTAGARLEEARDTAEARLEAERRRLEERAREEAESAREELEERARNLFRGLVRPRDTARDTTPPDTTERPDRRRE